MRSNVTREEKHLEDNQRCQLALLAHILFYSERNKKIAIMGDIPSQILHFHILLCAYMCT